MGSNRQERRAPAGPERRSRSLTPTRKTPWFKTEVVLIEDDRALAELIAFALESTGRLVTVYYDGATALRDLVALPDIGVRRLLLLSVDIGGVDGHTLHERLHALRPDSFLVAFMSARASEADQVRALRAGAVDYLVKPVSIHVLLEKVAAWVALIAAEE